MESSIFVSASFKGVFGTLKLTDGFICHRLYLERAHPAFLTTLVVLVLYKKLKEAFYIFLFRSLIDRCQALTETRNKLIIRLSETENETRKEAEAVEKMNEEKMIRNLNSNVKLGCLQTIYEKVIIKIFIKL